MQPVTTIVVLAVVAWPFASNKNLPPKHPMIGHGYYCCEKCHTLAGGIWGKGPTRWFKGPGQKECVHVWKEISREEFKALAVRLYGVDWSTEIPFWHWEEDSAKVLEEAQGRWIQIDAPANTTPIDVSLHGIDFAWSDGVNEISRGKLDAELTAEGRRRFSTVGSRKRVKGFFEVTDDKLVVWVKLDDSIGLDTAPNESYSRFTFRRENP
jgi:hypothetical protein